jgi:hypothetical protein
VPAVKGLAAERFSTIVRGHGTAWHDLLQRENVAKGFLDMASLNSMVTDSSAASSSWGSGSRVFNAAVNVLPDGTIQCAWHGARFDCMTGAVRQGPALTPLPTYEVRVDGDRVLVGTRKAS